VELVLTTTLNPIPVNEFGFYLSNPLGGLILGFFRMVDVGYANALGGILENGLFGTIIVVWV